MMDANTRRLCIIVRAALIGVVCKIDDALEIAPRNRRVCLVCAEKIGRETPPEQEREAKENN